MNNIFYISMTYLGGFALGALFFGGLWLTVKKALKSKWPALWILGSLVIRISTTLIGFYFISRGNWVNIIICLSGFISARIAFMILTKTKHRGSLEIRKEV